MSRLMEYLQREDRADVFLIGNDGIKVPALRCLLGLQSPYFDRLFFSPHFEQRSSREITFGEFSSNELEAIINFCNTNTADDYNCGGDDEYLFPAPQDEDSARMLVRIYHCAQYFVLSGLLQIILHTLNLMNMGSKNFHLMCAVFDETFAVGETVNEVKQCALNKMLQGRDLNALLPDWSVPARSGVALLKSSHAFREILHVVHLPQLSETFKLDAVKKWKEHSGIASSEVIVEELLPCIDLSRVDEGFLRKCDFVPSSVIAEAGEARQASKYVLVEGVPKAEANGRYERYECEGHCCYTKQARIDEALMTFFIQKDTDSWWCIYYICGFCGMLTCLCSCQGTGGDVPSDGWFKGYKGNETLPHLQCRVIEPTSSV